MTRFDEIEQERQAEEDAEKAVDKIFRRLPKGAFKIPLKLRQKKKSADKRDDR